jgi:predicted transcriptional regulator
MRDEKLVEWIKQPKNNQILLSFDNPKTPTEVQRDLNISKLNFNHFLKCGLITCLNPEMHKGRLYVLTNKSRLLLKVPNFYKAEKKDFNLIGMIMASPKQRYVILQTLGKDTIKRTSEEIRSRSSNLNPCLTRISTKAILKELIKMELVDSEMGNDRKRYFWITEKGMVILNDLH